MTFVALVLLGAGIIYIASALADETLLQTMQDFLAGKQIDWTGKAGAEQSGATYSPGQSIGGDVYAQGWPAAASEGGPAGVLHTAWNYCVETVGALMEQMAGGPQVSAAEIAQQAQDMVSHGWASGNPWIPPQWQANVYGISDFTGEQHELSSLGLQTNLINLGGMDLNALKTSVILPAVQSGRPVAFDNTKAYELYDLRTKTYPNSSDPNKPVGTGKFAVLNHAILIEGYDDQGVFAADPNSPDPGRIDLYSWESLIASAPNQALVPQ